MKTVTRPHSSTRNLKQKKSEVNPKPNNQQKKLDALKKTFGKISSFKWKDALIIQTQMRQDGRLS